MLLYLTQDCPDLFDDSAAISFVCAAILEQRARSASSKPSILWQLPQYLFISLAEALVGSTGLELAYNEAPDELRAVVTSMWLLTSAFGQALVIVLISVIGGGSVLFFVVCAVCMFVVGSGFMCVTRNYVYKRYSNK